MDRHCLLCMAEAHLTTPTLLTRLDHLKCQSCAALGGMGDLNEWLPACVGPSIDGAVRLFIVRIHESCADGWMRVSG